jgi:hypothetical protein
LTGWSYRKKITISGTTIGAQTNYQMKMTVYKSTGSDSGTAVYLGTRVKDDFSDLRFTKSDGTTLLGYWVESYTSGISATVWIAFDSIAASPSTTNFYMYYGNSGATSASSGVSTFLFFDDFLGSSLSSQWTFVQYYTNSPSSYSVSGGELRLISNSIYWTSAGVYSNAFSRTLNQGIRIRSKMKAGSEDTDWTLGWTQFTNRPDGDGQAVAETLGTGVETGSITDKFFNGNGATLWSETSTIGMNQNYHTYEQDHYVANSLIIIDNVQKYSGPNNDTNPRDTNYHVRLQEKYGVGYTATRSIYFDWVFAGKYVLPEPIWGAWGVEESR